MAKELIGVDKYDGSLYAYDPLTDAIYRAPNPGLGDLGEALWEKIADTITKTGIPAALADRIKGTGNKAGAMSPEVYAALLAKSQSQNPFSELFGNVSGTTLMLLGLVGVILFMKK